MKKNLLYFIIFLVLFLVSLSLLAATTDMKPISIDNSIDAVLSLMLTAGAIYGGHDLIKKRGM